jgi:hypothetical protein
MDRMLVVVFDSETKAYEGKKALLQLDNEGSISVYAKPLFQKMQMEPHQSNKAMTRGHSELSQEHRSGV